MAAWAGTSCRVADPARADAIAQAVDAISVNSDHETKTQSEHAFQLAFLSQFGDIGLIVGAIMAAVFFTLMLLTGNTMAQAVRERIPELAILKTIGFTSGSVLGLLLAEAMLLLLFGGVIGVLIAGSVASRARGDHRRRVPAHRQLAGGLGALAGADGADRSGGRRAAGLPRPAPAHRRRAGGTLRCHGNAQKPLDCRLRCGSASGRC